MVVFTCGHCGESITKPKVEKHYNIKCRNKEPNLSCMDCFKDFLGKEFESHTKCVTEEQRYAAKGFEAKPKKGEQKQNVWVELVQSVLDEQKNAPVNVIRIVEAISKHNNTPRKKPKFVNFVKNVCGHKTSPKDIEAAWELISVKLSALSITGNKDQVNQEKEQANNTAKKTNDINVDSSLVEPDNEIQEKVENAPVEIDSKNKSKKQKKEEKKRKKYEAEIQIASIPPPEEEPETKKKKRSKSECEKDTLKENGAENETADKGKKKKKTKSISEEAPIENEVQDVAEVQDGKKKKKLKACEDEIETINQNSIGSKEKFDWHATIISLLQKKNNEMPLKRLQKKVLSEYVECTGMDADDRIADKLIKKIKSAPNVIVERDRVVLL